MLRISAVTVVLIATVWGCKDASSFSGAGGKKRRPPPEVPADAQVNPEANGATQQFPESQAQNGGCYQDKQYKRFNVVLSFDSSASMKNVDPNFARALGAELLVGRLADLSAQQPNMQFQVGMVRFSHSAEQGRQGWVPVNPGSVGALRQEIQMITANPSGGTSYVEGLRATGNLFTQINAGSPDSRNFVVFLTDGDPADAPFEIQQEVEMLTRTFNAVIVAIAAGEQISPDGVGLVRSMAQPRVPLGSDPRHVGRFHQVIVAQQLSGIFDQVFQDTFACVPGQL